MDETMGQNNNIKIDKKEINENNKEFQVNRKLNPNIEYSESIKLKDLTDKKEIGNSQLSPHNLNSTIIDIENQKKIFFILKELEKRTLNISVENKYGNSILLGSFCNFISFLTFGLYKAGVFQDEYTNIWTNMVLFGGLGQMTAGLMELTKGREFPSFIYIIYGLYCFSHYILRINLDRLGRFDICIFYIACLLLSIPVILYSLKINLIFLIQSSFVTLYFLISSIGEGIDEFILNEKVAGSFLIISSLLSLYLFLSQAFNQYNMNYFIHTFPFDINNKVDFIQKNLNKEHKN